MNQAIRSIKNLTSTIIALVMGIIVYAAKKRVAPNTA
jgi:hypothetical protein